MIGTGGARAIFMHLLKSQNVGSQRICMVAGLCNFVSSQREIDATRKGDNLGCSNDIYYRRLYIPLSSHDTFCLFVLASILQRTDDME